MPRFKVVAWAPDGKRTSEETYDTVFLLRDGLRAVADSRHHSVLIEVLDGFWGMVFLGLVQDFADGDFAPTTGPYKRDWYYHRDVTDDTWWRSNLVGTIAVKHAVAGWSEFEPRWVEFDPPAPQAA